ncbi:MAG: hypothetical protein ABI204_08745 [Ginsengibacter sp.]
MSYNNENQVTLSIQELVNTKYISILPGNPGLVKTFSFSLNKKIAMPANKKIND